MMGADVANAGFRKTESRFAETGNSKFQIPNFKQIPNSKLQILELTRFRGHLILYLAVVLDAFSRRGAGP